MRSLTLATRFLAVVTLFVAATSSAKAEEVDSEVSETDASMTVAITGQWATVTQTHRFTTRNGASDLTYRFLLPTNAVITSAKFLGVDGLAVDDSQHLSVAAKKNGLPADLGLLELVDTELDFTAYAFSGSIPPPLTTATFVVVWHVPLDIRNGETQLALPRRGEHFAPRSVTVNASGQAIGASVSKLTANGATTAGTTLHITQPATSGLNIAVSYRFASELPLLTRYRQNIAGCVVGATQVISPPLASVAQPQKQLLILVDGSKSMELIGKSRIASLVASLLSNHASQSQQPLRSQVLLYDRGVSEVFRGEVKPASTTPKQIALEIKLKQFLNGSDPAVAAKAALAAFANFDRQFPLDVVWVTDAAFEPSLDSAKILSEFANSTLPATMLRLHVVALHEGASSADSLSANAQPGLDTLAGIVKRVGGTVSLASAAEANTELADQLLSEQLAHGGGWQQLRSANASEPPVTLKSGSTQWLSHELSCEKKANSTGYLALRDDTWSMLAPRKPRQVPFLRYLLSHVSDDSATEPELMDDLHEVARQQFPAVTESLSFVFPSRTTKAAAQRATMLKAGAPFVRIFREAFVHAGARASITSVRVAEPVVFAETLNKATVSRILQLELLPRARGCFQRNLTKGLGNAPRGQAMFHLTLGRGEVVSASVEGLAASEFTTCLVDAAYQLDIPKPAPGAMFDELVRVNYPVQFNVSEDKGQIVAGDANSSQPLQLEHINDQPAKPQPIEVDASRPLSGLRPQKQESDSNP